jgi:hypothetical protein
MGVAAGVGCVRLVVAAGAGCVRLIIAVAEVGGRRCWCWVVAFVVLVGACCLCCCGFV